MFCLLLFFCKKNTQCCALQTTFSTPSLLAKPMDREKRRDIQEKIGLYWHRNKEALWLCWCPDQTERVGITPFFDSGSRGVPHIIPICLFIWPPKRAVHAPVVAIGPNLVLKEWRYVPRLGIFAATPIISTALVGTVLPSDYVAVWVI